MSDLVDEAQARELEFREDAIRARDRRRASAAYPVLDAPAKPRGCADCGDPIPLARLHAVPSTRRCAFCAEQAEFRAQIR